MIEDIRTWSGPIASLLAIGGIVYTWLTARSTSNEGKIQAHEKKLIEHDRRVQALEGEFTHLPTKDDFALLRIAIEQIKAPLGRLEENQAGLERAVRRIDEFLMKNRG
ncbi:MAG: DUF2730 family protein [Nitratireductor sp.]|uniref:DUF2730 family protein n=1 Tax=Parvibaculum sp. TaxID=2024848 RepID=UPI0032913FA8